MLGNLAQQQISHFFGRKTGIFPPFTSLFFPSGQAPDSWLVQSYVYCNSGQLLLKPSAATYSAYN